MFNHKVPPKKEKQTSTCFGSSPSRRLGPGLPQPKGEKVLQSCFLKSNHWYVKNRTPKRLPLQSKWKNSLSELVPSINLVNPFLTPRKGSSGLGFPVSKMNKSRGSRCNLLPVKRKLMTVVIQSSTDGKPSGGQTTLMQVMGTVATMCCSSSAPRSIEVMS